MITTYNIFFDLSVAFKSFFKLYLIEYVSTKVMGSFRLEVFIYWIIFLGLYF